MSGLYLVSTPIGNLGDMSARSREALEQADVLACEDTRNAKKLLTLLGIAYPKTFIAYHEYNADKMRPKLLNLLQQGQTVVLVSDAGTPLISDPGYRLVRDCLDAQIAVVPIPGANAVLPALQLSGLPTDRFLFNGFLPHKQGARKAELALLKDIPATLVFYESPHRVPETLADMYAVLGDRSAAVVRELTKKFEEVRRGSLSELAQFYAQEGHPMGEIVLVVDRAVGQAETYDISAMLEQELKDKTLRDAVDAVTKKTGLDRKKIYAQALCIKNNKDN